MGGYRWKEEDMQFLRDNHREMQPGEMGQVIGREYGSVTLKMKKMGLKVRNVIMKDEATKMMDRLIEMGMLQKDIIEMTGLYDKYVGRYIITKAQEKEIKIKKGFSKKHRTKQFSEIRVINSSGLKDFEAFDKDELYRYDELSPSEKIIYHGLDTNQKQTA